MQVVLNNYNTVILLANQIVLSASHIEQQHERITSRPTIRRRLSNYAAYPSVQDTRVSSSFNLSQIQNLHNELAAISKRHTGE